MSLSTGSIVGDVVTSSPSNPLLALQPAYSRSLVVQLLVLSAVCALHIVLMLHLLFTTRYHLPLSKMNYFLLTGGCLISFVAIVWQMLECALSGRARSQEWPYMFDYLQYSFPSANWSEAKKVWWLLLNAAVVFLCHVGRSPLWCKKQKLIDHSSQAAHIHVLTLLYPSKLETRLFMILLLPLAFTSCALSFSPLLSSQREQDIFDSGSAVCNSALTLLYTCALFFWGLYIARKRAWGQADASGSTAVFGGCALGMAILGTVLAFVGISRGAQSVGNDGWLDRVTWLVLLWQTWFSVWWWIGAGMYGAERPLEEEGMGDTSIRSASIPSKYRGDRNLRQFVGDNFNTLRRKTRRKEGQDEDDDAMEMTSMNGTAVDRPRQSRSVPSARATVDTSSSSSASTGTPPTFIQTLIRHIKKAHVSGVRAAHKEMLQTAEQNPRMNDAIIGRRGKGWSVGGILQSRENNVVQNAARDGGRGSRATREDRRLGAARLSNDEGTGPWEDFDDAAGISRPGHQRQYSKRAKPKPVTKKKLQNWRRRDVTTYD